MACKREQHGGRQVGHRHLSFLHQITGVWSSSSGTSAVDFVADEHEWLKRVGIRTAQLARHGPSEGPLRKLATGDKSSLRVWLR
jgi:hypothetical protein